MLVLVEECNILVLFFLDLFSLLAEPVPTQLIEHLVHLFVLGDLLLEGFLQKVINLPQLVLSNVFVLCQASPYTFRRRICYLGPGSGWLLVVS